MLPDLPHFACNIFDPTATILGLVVCANQWDTPKTQSEVYLLYSNKTYSAKFLYWGSSVVMATSDRQHYFLNFEYRCVWPQTF